MRRWKRLMAGLVCTALLLCTAGTPFLEQSTVCAVDEKILSSNGQEEAITDASIQTTTTKSVLETEKAPGMSAREALANTLQEELLSSLHPATTETAIATTTQDEIGNPAEPAARTADPMLSALTYKLGTFFCNTGEIIEVPLIAYGDVAVSSFSLGFDFGLPVTSFKPGDAYSGFFVWHKDSMILNFSAADKQIAPNGSIIGTFLINVGTTPGTYSLNFAEDCSVTDTNGNPVDGNLLLGSVVVMPVETTTIETTTTTTFSTSTTTLTTTAAPLTTKIIPGDAEDVMTLSVSNENGTCDLYFLYGVQSLFYAGAGFTFQLGDRRAAWETKTVYRSVVIDGVTYTAGELHATYLVAVRLASVPNALAADAAAMPWRVNVTRHPAARPKEKPHLSDAV